MRIVVALLLLIVAYARASCAADMQAASEFVGSADCGACHAKEYAAWQGSQHRAAMQQATETTVLGDFNDAHYTYGRVTTTFFKRGGKFFVKTDGPRGKLVEYPVSYTFGVDPLQQYLLELPGGRLQALSIAWDVDKKRWFHLYPKEHVTPADELHWTKPTQNWNYMCADCHSTALRKNYDSATDRFDTQWAEISVGCEACHGPGKNHDAWAYARRAGAAASAGGSQGLAAPLDERHGVSWSRAAADATATRSKPRGTEQEIGVCAQCHARRGQIADGYSAGKAFLDYYRPALLNPPLYYADGQQRDEVYGWGSFLQSKMYAAGVTCSDCHEPHSSRPRAEGNALCLQCHAATVFDNPAHHHHPAGSTGAQCANCHMPTTTYMVVDPRHDHSLRVPRPDLSVQLGTPNACNGCHSNRDARWAAAQVRAWFARDPQGYQRFATAFASANAGAVGSLPQLRAVAGDSGEAAIARATALAEIDANANSATLDLVAKGLRDPNALVRLGAIEALSGAPAELRLRYGAPLLADSSRVLRTEAASMLADVPLTSASSEQRSDFERAAAEYVSSQRYNGDRAEARVNLGSFEAKRGDVAGAEQELRAALTLDALFTPAYVNLADLYRAQGREVDAEHVLRDGVGRMPKSGVLHYALGLSLVRQKHADQAISEFALATRLDLGNARFAYVYGVALHSSGHVAQAIATLTRASKAHPADIDILQALASFYETRGDEAEARRYADRVREVMAADR